MGYRAGVMGQYNIAHTERIMVPFSPHILIDFLKGTMATDLAGVLAGKQIFVRLFGSKSDDLKNVFTLIDFDVFKLSEWWKNDFHTP
jgi:hypothetical protein